MMRAATTSQIGTTVRHPTLRWLALVLMAAFAIVGLQTLRLAVGGTASAPRANLAEPLVRTYTRPDILDRKGRLLATDVIVQSIFADPAFVVDADEAAEKLAETLPGLNAAELRTALSDRSRRFVWVRRGVAPSLAQRVHDLGLAGIAQRAEPRRLYPQGRMAGHVLGSVGSDNRGLAGIESHIDEKHGLETAFAPGLARTPVTLTLDIGAQHGLEEELSLALAQFGATGAAGVVLVAATGEVIAAASLPDADPARPGESLLPDRLDRLSTATYELGSIMKVFTVALALEHGLATPASVIDVRLPVTAAGWTIRDPHPSGRPLTVREILVQSSNVGAARLALDAGPSRQRAFLAKAGLLQPMRTEAGGIGAPRLPERWGEAETATIAYGYGLALAPLQAAAAAAALVNGGTQITPRFISPMTAQAATDAAGPRVVSAATSAHMRDLLRRAVTDPRGTGRLADVPGLDVGGKTGTAEMAARGSYRQRAVVTSFLGAFPMSAPRYVVLVTLVEPKPSADGTSDRITASANAAPVAGRLIRRIAPALGFAPR